jgi:glycosyltransferase involved in cell wall biosynthesis
VHPEGLVSVIIPAHNAGAVISEALQSVREQTRPAGEIIVVDDGSTDNTGDIVEAFKDVVLLRQSKQGAAEARNAGVRRATKPYLAVLDADDMWPATRLERQLAPLIDDPELDFVSGSIVQFKRGASGVMVPLSAPAASRLPSVLLMRREAFWKVGPFSARWEVGETIEWWSRAVDVGLRGRVLPEIVLLRRIHSDNLGKTARHPASAYLHMLHAVIDRRRKLGS